MTLIKITGNIKVAFFVVVTTQLNFQTLEIRGCH